jgi:hypothetical protein
MHCCESFWQVNQAFIAEDVRDDFEAGLEYAEAAAILRMVQRGDQRQYLIRSTVQHLCMCALLFDLPPCC